MAMVRASHPAMPNIGRRAAALIESFEGTHAEDFLETYEPAAIEEDEDSPDGDWDGEFDEDER